MVFGSKPAPDQKQVSMQRMKMVHQAQACRGIDVLIRKQNDKIAAKQKLAAMEAGIRGPNKGIRNINGDKCSKKPLCAAEMTD